MTLIQELLALEAVDKKLSHMIINKRDQKTVAYVGSYSGAKHELAKIPELQQNLWEIVPYMGHLDAAELERVRFKISQSALHRTS